MKKNRLFSWFVDHRKVYDTTTIKSEKRDKSGDMDITIRTVVTLWTWLSWFAYYQIQQVHTDNAITDAEKENVGRALMNERERARRKLNIIMRNTIVPMLSRSPA